MWSLIYDIFPLDFGICFGCYAHHSIVLVSRQNLPPSRTVAPQATTRQDIFRCCKSSVHTNDGRGEHAKDTMVLFAKQQTRVLTYRVVGTSRHCLSWNRFVSIVSNGERDTRRLVHSVHHFSWEDAWCVYIFVS